MKPTLFCTTQTNDLPMTLPYNVVKQHNLRVLLTHQRQKHQLIGANPNQPNAITHLFPPISRFGVKLVENQMPRYG